MAITASVQPDSGRIVYYAGSDLPHPFQLRFFQRRHGSYCAKLTRIRSGWPGQGFNQTRMVRKQAGVQESSGPVSGRTEPACYQFPTFRLDSVRPQTARIILKLGTRRTAETATTTDSHQRACMHVFHVPFTSITHAACYRVKFRR